MNWDEENRFQYSGFLDQFVLLWMFKCFKCLEEFGVRSLKLKTLSPLENLHNIMPGLCFGGLYVPTIGGRHEGVSTLHKLALSARPCVTIRSTSDPVDPSNQRKYQSI
jgi:hypothetical protein